MAGLLEAVVPDTTSCPAQQRQTSWHAVRARATPYQLLEANLNKAAKT